MIIPEETSISMVPKTAVIGADSYLGRRLLTEYRRLYPDCVGTSRRPDPGSLARFDLLDPDIAPLRLRETGHEAAAICGAVNDSVLCETDRRLSRRINVECTLQLFHNLSDQRILPIFFSSDNVFDGTKSTAYTEDDPPNPLLEYGRHKAEVETEIRKSGRPHIVCRLSKVFGTRRGDEKFIAKSAETLIQGKEILAASDLIFNPVCVEDVIRAVSLLQRNGFQGLIHVSSPETWSRYALMLTLADSLGCDTRLVKQISLDDVTHLSLPKNLMMSCKKLLETTAMTFTPMLSCLKELRMEYAQQEWLCR